MRGKPDEVTAYQEATRITPAGAGKTAAGLSDCRAGWDHPRRCGENLIYSIVTLSVKGSPPQVRGKLFRFPHKTKEFRITPAGAGKTYIKSQPDVRIKDHPRRCGENSPPAQRWEQPVGSPPQVRGKLNGVNGALDSGRITPAGAGKTAEYECRPDSKQDHPRRCGENVRGCTAV